MVERKGERGGLSCVGLGLRLYMEEDNFLFHSIFFSIFFSILFFIRT